MFRTIHGYVLAGLIGLVVPVASADARDLTITAWGGASQAVLRKVEFEPFMKETNIKLIEDSWSGGVGVLRTKVQGGNANWDVVQVEVDELILGCEEGLFEKMDWQRLGGKDKFIEAAQHDCGVGAETWSVSFAYDGDRLRSGPASWKEFWDVGKFPGKRGMRKTAKYTLEAALMADGVPISDVYKVLFTPAGIDRAFKKLDELKPNITWWSSPSQVAGMLAAGDVAVSMTTAGRLFAANATDKKNFKFEWNQSIYAVDFWAVLKNSPNKEQAMQFIAFASRPDIQSKIPTLIALGATNKEAIQLVNPKEAPNNPSDPERLKNALAINPAFWVENSDQLTQRFNAWAAK